MTLRDMEHERVFSALVNTLQTFPKITTKDSLKLYELIDILVEILTLKESESYKVALSYFNSSVGVAPILSKIPHVLLEKWMAVASN